MSVPWESLANEHILGIAPYEPGKPIEEAPVVTQFEIAPAAERHTFLSSRTLIMVKRRRAPRH